MNDYQTKNFQLLEDSIVLNMVSFLIILFIRDELINIYLRRIVDLVSFKNINNKGNTSIINPWEEFFINLLTIL